MVGYYYLSLLAGTRVNHMGVLVVDSFSDSSLTAGILIFILSFLISCVSRYKYIVISIWIKITQNILRQITELLQKNILSDNLPTKYTLQSSLKNLYICCTVFVWPLT